ncbi:MAG TPA: hypothetical protein VHB50_15650, partial [Bryobacteraceae bacterium]|nr:hypothetical protein [Bryobacteraceae bacterium]
PLKFEEALHSYFAVSDVREVSVSGLEGTTYVDKTDAFRSKSQPDEPLKIGKETDQVHLNTTATCVISDPLWNRRIVVDKTGSNTTVVWNPWSEKSAAMADMGPDEWGGMICVESANAAENAVTLEPRSSHTLGVTIRVE